MLNMNTVITDDISSDCGCNTSCVSTTCIIGAVKPVNPGKSDNLMVLLLII